MLGYLAVGAAIGEHGFDILRDPNYTHKVAEFGVVFLLFVIGLELTLDRIWQMRKYVFGYGGAQVVITTSILCVFLIYYSGMPGTISIIIAASLTFSSTAVVLQILGEGKRQDSQVGRLSLAVFVDAGSGW